MAFQGDSIFWVEVEKIVPNPYQPRREFDEERLKELSESVRMYGILQPLTVTRREVQGDDGSFRSEYELIAGERRLRASKLAGLSQVPVIIREGEQSEQEKLELAIIENLQREDLNAVDRALAFRQLADVFGLSHVQVAKKVGRSREYVSNTIRLLALPDYMLSSLRTADISEGHARTLLMLNDRPEEQDTVFREILMKKLSVRDVERIARGIATEKVRKKENIDTNLLEFERQFTETLGTRVSIIKTDFGGKVTIDYFSIEDLELMLEKMRTEASQMAVGSSSELVSESVDEAAEALAILSERTGLEAVSTAPKVSEMSPVVPTININQSDTSVEIPESTSDPVSPPFIPQPIPMPMVPEPVKPPLVTPVPPTEPVPPANISAVPTSVTQVASPARLSLRDQLASLLGQTVTAKSEVSPIAPVVTVETDIPAVPPVEKKTDKDSDDSSLYSIRDFTV